MAQYASNLLQEQYLFLEHFKVCREDFLNYPVPERRQMIEHFVNQKEREEAALNKNKK
jgi:hypothetical protein